MNVLYSGLDFIGPVKSNSRLLKAKSSARLITFITQLKSGFFKICLFLFLLISFPYKQATGQQNNLILKSHSYGIENGLSSSALSWPYMDSQGLIWMGHELGIDRFDGHHVEYYSNQEFFPNLGFFYQIIEDASGKFWVLGNAAEDRKQTVLYLFDHE